MRQLSIAAVLVCACFAGNASLYDFTLNSIDGQPAPIAAYKGKVLLMVNVASKCGFTPQYEALEGLYEKYKTKGLVVLGFPANNFLSQEPGTNSEIKDFCERTYHVKFPMYAKISVKGDDKAPLYHYLTEKETNPTASGEIKWNFTKFLVSKDGKILARFEPAVKPDSPEAIAAIEKALSE